MPIQCLVDHGDLVCISQHPEAMATFQVGDQVQWISGARGTVTLKVGTIIAVVPAGEAPPRKGLRDPGVPRDHESYIIKVVAQRYWPHVNKLTRSHGGAL